MIKKGFLSVGLIDLVYILGYAPSDVHERDVFHKIRPKERGGAPHDELFSLPQQVNDVQLRAFAQARVRRIYSPTKVPLKALQEGPHIAIGRRKAAIPLSASLGRLNRCCEGPV